MDNFIVFAYTIHINLILKSDSCWIYVQNIIQQLFFMNKLWGICV